jgi:hypothetical protein
MMMNHLKPMTLAVMLALLISPALAQTTGVNPNAERESLEVLRNTTRNLIEALVESGVLPREKADKLIHEAEQKALQTAKANAATLASAAAAAPAVRVQYMPESVKNEIREQLRQEVLAQAKEERWANPNIVPSWVSNVSMHGDVLVRDQFDNYARENAVPSAYYQYAGATTRNAALADSGLSSGNTTNDLNRMRLRARLGFDIKASSDSSAEVRIVTGSSNARNSTMQTMGDGLNKYSMWVDRAAISYRPTPYVNLKAGRMGNPFVTSDLVWDDNVNFDGMALNFKPPLDEGFAPFATMGYFPLSTENTPKYTQGRYMVGGQLGAATDLSVVTRARFALGYYNFRNIEGRLDDDSCYLVGVGSTCNTYGNAEYPSSWRNQGNTLVRLNAPSDSSATSIWGLASKFRPLHLNFNVDSAPFDPVHLVFSADYVKNMAFDRGEIKNRTGADFVDGKSTGYQFKFLVGTPSIKRQDEWNTSLTFRSLGSDAVPDAWADGALGLGGTNMRGFIVGGAYGIADNTTLGLRYLSGRTIDSPTMINDSDKFRVDSWQMDLNVRF